MATGNPMLTPREAARLLGVSYPAIKQWILSGKLKTVQTPGGHHRIAQSTLKPFLARDKVKPTAESRERYRRVSGRNQLAGKIISIRVEVAGDNKRQCRNARIRNQFLHLLQLNRRECEVRGGEAERGPSYGNVDGSQSAEILNGERWDAKLIDVVAGLNVGQGRVVAGTR